MKLFEYIRNLFKRLILKIIKKKKAETSSVILSKDIEDKFNSKQKKVLAEGIQLGLDISRIAKKKYTAEQMVLLLYGLLMGLDISSFESYSMPVLEMELHLYQEAMKKFLGKNYLLRLLQETGGTMEDGYIRKRINKDLEDTMSVVFELAPTLLTAPDEVEDRTEEDDFYDILLQMCEDRDLDSSKLTKSTIPVMIYNYEKLEKEFTNQLDKKSVSLKRLKDFTLQPSLQTLLTKLDVQDRVEPVKLWVKGKFVTDYYRVNNGIHIYLYRKGFLTIKIR